MAKGLSDKRLLELARKAVPGLETLQTRNSDRLDFYELAVWNLVDALRAAYELGKGGGMLPHPLPASSKKPATQATRREAESKIVRTRGKKNG